MSLGLSNTQAVVTSNTKTTRRPYNRKVALLGHSKAGQSITGRRNMVHGFMTYAKFLSRQRFSFEPEMSYGVNGDTPVAANRGGTDYPGIYNRLIGPVDATAFPGVPQNMLSTTDASVIIVEAFTNYWDVTGANYADAVSYATLMQTAIVNGGRICAWLVDDPRGETTNGTTQGNRLSAQSLKYALEFRLFLLSQRTVPGVIVMDSWEALSLRSSTVGDMISGYSYDGLHLNQTGAKRLGRIVQRYLDTVFEPLAIIPASNAEVYSADLPNGALNANPYFTGTGGTLNGFTGQLADNWAFVTNAIGVTFAGAKITAATSFNSVAYTDEVSKDWQQVTIGGTATGTTEIVVLAQTVSSNITVGDVLRAVAEIEIDSLVNISTLNLSIMDSVGTTILAADFSGTTNVDAFAMPNEAMAGVMLTPTTLPVSATTARIQIRLKPAATGSISGVFRIRGASMFKAL